MDAVNPERITKQEKTYARFTIKQNIVALYNSYIIMGVMFTNVTKYTICSVYKGWKKEYFG